MLALRFWLDNAQNRKLSNKAAFYSAELIGNIFQAQRGWTSIPVIPCYAEI